jgi:hypothetical protein
MLYSTRKRSKQRRNGIEAIEKRQDSVMRPCLVLALSVHDHLVRAPLVRARLVQDQPVRDQSFLDPSVHDQSFLNPSVQDQPAQVRSVLVRLARSVLDE